MAALLTTFSAQSTATTDVLVLTVPSALPAGTLVVVCGNHAAGPTTTPGGAVTDSAGNTYTLDAAAVRASTHDMMVWSSVLTSPLPIGGTITVDWVSTAGRSVALASAWSGAGERLATSGDTVSGSGGTSNGPNGTGTAVAPTTLTAAAGLVLGHCSRAGTATATPDADTLVGTLITTFGSGDRGLAVAWREDEDAVAQSTAWTLSVSQGWAAMETVYELTAPVESDFTLWNGTTEVPLAATLWNGTTEVPLSAEVT